MDFINRQVAVDNRQVAKASCRDPAMYPVMRCEWCGTETTRKRGAVSVRGGALCWECGQEPGVVSALELRRKAVDELRRTLAQRGRPR